MDQFVYGLSSPDEGKTFDLDIFSDIGEGGLFSVGKSANDVRRELLAAPSAKLIRQRINSRGGDVFEAIAMHSLLMQHPARVEAIVMGVAASAATIPMLAADEISIVEQGLVMIHDVWGGAKGSPDDLRDWADVLEKVNGSVAALYAKRTKKPRAEIDGLMSAETWMTADEAKSLGFVDKILALKTPEAKKAKAFAFAMARDMAKAPAAALALLETAGLTDPQEAPSARVGDAVSASLPPGATALATLNISPEAPGKAPEAPAPKSDPTENPMTIPKNITQALALAEDADEAAIVSAIGKFKANAKAVAEIESMLGCSGAALVGRVRALQEAQAQNESLAVEVEKIKVASARRDFETLRDQGLKDKKLSGPLAKMYNDRFAKATKLDESGVPAGDGSDVVADLTEYLAHAQRRPDIQPPPADGGTNVGAAQHGGKAFEDMKPGERLKLKRENVELYNTLREDAQARNAL
jgi:ATP-dependent protease ClpP protease subunit